MPRNPAPTAARPIFVEHAGDGNHVRRGDVPGTWVPCDARGERLGQITYFGQPTFAPSMRASLPEDRGCALPNDRRVLRRVEVVIVASVWSTSVWAILFLLLGWIDALGAVGAVAASVALAVAAWLARPTPHRWHLLSYYCVACGATYEEKLNGEIPRWCM